MSQLSIWHSLQDQIWVIVPLLSINVHILMDCYYNKVLYLYTSILVQERRTKRESKRRQSRSNEQKAMTLSQNSLKPTRNAGCKPTCTEQNKTVLYSGTVQKSVYLRRGLENFFATCSSLEHSSRNIHRGVVLRVISKYSK